ncbi:MAG: hypothetical protein SGPRY_004522 [Prymnesium sp.]
MWDLLEVGARVWPTVLRGKCLASSHPGAASVFLHRGMVCVKFAAIERKVQVVKTRWCTPLELEPLRASPRVEKSASSKRAFEQLDDDMEPEMQQAASDAPELAQHERVRKMAQKVANEARPGNSTKWAASGMHKTPETRVSLEERIQAFPNQSIVIAPSPLGKVLFCRCDVCGE